MPDLDYIFLRGTLRRSNTRNRVKETRDRSPSLPAMVAEADLLSTQFLVRRQFRERSGNHATSLLSV